MYAHTQTHTESVLTLCLWVTVNTCKLQCNCKTLVTDTGGGSESGLTKIAASSVHGDRLYFFLFNFKCYIRPHLFEDSDSA